MAIRKSVVDLVLIIVLRVIANVILLGAYY